MNDHVMKLRAVLTGFGRDTNGNHLANSVVIDDTGKIVWQTERRRVQAVGTFCENGTIGALISRYPDREFNVISMIGSAHRNFVELTIDAVRREALHSL